MYLRAIEFSVVVMLIESLNLVEPEMKSCGLVACTSISQREEKKPADRTRRKEQHNNDIDHDGREEAVESERGQ